MIKLLNFVYQNTPLVWWGKPVLHILLHAAPCPPNLSSLPFHLWRGREWALATVIEICLHKKRTYWQMATGMHPLHLKNVLPCLAAEAD